MATALIPVRKSFAALEDTLQAFRETEEFVTPEQEVEFRRAVEDAITETVEKRNNFYRWLRSMKLSEANCLSEKKNQKAEADRLSNAAKAHEARWDRLRGYIRGVIEGLGIDPKTDKYKVLRCDYGSFAVTSGKESVEIQDAAKVPDQYKYITVTLPVALWRALRHEVDNTENDAFFPIGDALEAAEERGNIAVNEEQVGAAIKGGATYMVTRKNDAGEDVTEELPGVPGADMVKSPNVLVVR